MAEKESEYSGQLKLPDVAINPFRTKPPEGQMMAVLKSNRDGALDTIIASVSGWHFRHQETGYVIGDEWEKWELLPDIDPLTGVRVYTPTQQSMPEAEFGVIVVGFLRALYIPHIRYSKWELKEGKTEPGLVRKDRADSPFFFFQYTMGIPVLDVESTGNIKTTININLVVRMINPYKAQFLAGGWESLLDAAVHGAVRDHLAELNVEEIRKEAESGNLTNRILQLNDDDDLVKNIDGFRKKFGIEIRDVRFVGFEIKGDARVEEALQAKEINRLLADAKVEEARGILTLAKAQADATKLSVEAYGSGEAAAQVRTYELVRDALLGTNAGVVSLGTPTPIAITPPSKKE